MCLDLNWIRLACCGMSPTLFQGIECELHLHKRQSAARRHTIINDVTARDVQMRHQQWHLGKSFDTFCPMGPWISTVDSLDASNTRVRCWVNGELRQDGQTRDLIFDIPAMIETCSRGITLYPGDIIATGTPAGVGMGLPPPKHLEAGDVVRIEIGGLGAIENRFVTPQQ